MNTEALVLFLIILLGLVLCFFLGGKEGFTGSFSGKFTVPNGESSLESLHKPRKNSKRQYKQGAHKKTGGNAGYDNYNHYNKSSNLLTNGATFYGPNGGKVVVTMNSNGEQSLNVTTSSGESPITFTSSSYGHASEGYENYGTGSDSESDSSSKTFYGPNGASASVVKEDGQTEIQVSTGSGEYVYTTTGSNKDLTTSTQYYGSTGYSVQPSEYSLAYQGPYGGTATVTATPSSQAPTSSPNSAYYSSMPQGIPKSQIPAGQEDMYILKSEIVPPVCPACPVAPASCPRQEKCPPCPACARCPEPAFECKKVPNYNAINNEYLPAPIVNDFSQFGM
jgi:hypothetical protein